MLASQVVLSLRVCVCKNWYTCMPLHDAQRTRNLLGTKILVLLLLGLLKLASGLAPIFLKPWIKDKHGAKWVDKLTGIVLCFGGGVLLATVFVHMVPEVCKFGIFSPETSFLENQSS